MRYCQTLNVLIETREQFLCNCIAIVLKQSAEKFRVSLIDYVSLDNTAEIISGLLKEDRGVAFIVKRANESRIDPYNDGFDCLHANYLLIISTEYGLPPGAYGWAAQVKYAHSRAPIHTDRCHIGEFQ